MSARAVTAAARVMGAAMERGQTTPAQLAVALDSAQMLMSPGKAAELVALRNDALNMRGALSPNGSARRVPMELGRELAPVVEWLLNRVAELETQREALAERLRAGQHWQRGRNPELVSENYVSQSELREIFGIPLTAPWENESTAKCRCDEPGVDPYACEAEDCTHEFSELSPFGGGSGPVEGHDAKVSRTCGCGWTTSVWHVADGSAEAELHDHVTRVHGGTAPQTGGVS